MVSQLKVFCLENRKSLGVAAAVVPLVVLISLISRPSVPDMGTVPVSGVVSLDGQPLASIVVSFEPVLDGASSGDVTAQPGSFGITDEDGRYELKWSKGTGAVPGTHQVILVWRDPERMEPGLETEPTQTPSTDEDGPIESEPVFLLPESARDGSRRFTVPESGIDTADFLF